MQADDVPPGISNGLLRRTLLLGELALDGTLRRVRGVLPVLLYAKEKGYDRAIVPMDNFSETQIAGGIEVFGCSRLNDALLALVHGSDDGFGAHWGLRTIHGVYERIISNPPPRVGGA